ncbi:four helix bundle protein [Candidatus Falkowbacteria bacterium]|nr:four helix bundle protein [Candidatus Falkowbacteria bacterium]
MTIKKLVDLEVWQEARKLCRGVYIIIRVFPKTEEWNIKKHLRESARGTVANIAEGFGRYFYKESLKFYGVAMGCLEEVRSDLYISFDNGYINEETLNKFLKQVDKVQAKLNGLIASTNDRIKNK